MSAKNPDWKSTDIPDCFVIERGVHSDARGSFVKMFERADFSANGVRFNFDEVYFSNSHQNVIRGLHFQTPPFDHTKVVTCLQGKILDVVIDLRRNSPSFQRSLSFELSPEKGTTVIIPRGCAHGFYSRTDNSMMAYLVETGHSPAHDQGILWSSIPFQWPTDKPIISVRDEKFPSLQDFETPFLFSKQS